MKYMVLKLKNIRKVDYFFRIESGSLSSGSMYKLVIRWDFRKDSLDLMSMNSNSSLPLWMDSN